MEYCVLRAGTDVEHRMEVRRSVFLTRLVRVESEDQARTVTAEQRRAHHDARHHVSAFVLGPDRAVRRSSDDGEPAGTAGMPTLEVLLAGGRPDEPLSDVVAVTTRWFGGIKLGAGGLVRAYGEAVARALDRAPLSVRALLARFGAEVSLAEAGHAEAVLRSAGLGVTGVDYGPDGATIGLAADAGPETAVLLADRVSGLLGRRVGLAERGTCWADR